jgi:GNAT superfamily N-acetyltransferase
MTAAIEYRAYRPGDERGIVELFLAVYGRHMGHGESSAHWAWEFRDSPFGPAEIELAIAGGRIVGQYAVVPRRLSDGSWAALSLDTMTHPEFQGKGIFTRTASVVYERLRDRGFRFVYGFPNENSVSGFVKRLEWRVPGRGRVELRLIAGSRSRPLRALGVGVRRMADALLVTERSDPTASVREGTAIPEGYDALWSRTKASYGLCVDRDAAYAAWRYLRRPGTEYRMFGASRGDELTGMLVTQQSQIRGMSVLFVCELLAETSAVGEALLRAAVDAGAAEGAACIAALTLPEAGGAGFAGRRHGFRPLPERLYARPLHFGWVGFDAASRVSCPLGYVSWGDTDVI